jgi:hypothetical protein
MGFSDGFSSRQKADSRGPEKRDMSADDGPAEARIFADAQMSGAGRSELGNGSARKTC